MIFNGTLNYCLRTHDSDLEDTRYETSPVVITTPNTSLLSESLFKPTKATSGDGIIALTEHPVVQNSLI